MRFEIVISDLDYLIIQRVIELRINSNPYLDQVTLSQKIGVSEGYIGKIENPKERAKFNIRLLGKVATALNLDSYQQLLPKDLPKNDLVKIIFEERESYSNKHVFGQDGNLKRKYKQISKEPLSEKEIKEWISLGSPYIKILDS